MNEQLESILLRVSQSDCIDDGDLKQAARLILDCVVEGLGVKRTGIWLLDDDNESIVCRLLIDAHNNTEVEDIVLTRQEFPRYFQALDSERAIRINDALTDPVTTEFVESYLTPLGIGCMLDTPIRHRGRMIGIICSEGIERGHQWSDDEATFSGVLSDLYGRAISSSERAKLEEALRTVNAELEQTIAQRTQALHATLQELKETQAHLIENEKMAALGGLVSGVAHEVNTPLGVAITSMSYIKDEVEQLRRDYQQGRLDEQGFTHFLSEFDMAYLMLRSNLGRAAKLVSDFKKTAVDQSSDIVESICLKDTIDALLTSLHPMYKQKLVQIHLTIPDQLAMVTHSGAIDQILTNLISNSCVHGFQDMVPENCIFLDVAQAGEQVVIDYRDNGVGMPQEVCQRVFEPFYTTNRANGGSGLGMSITYNLVTQKLKGTIRVLNDVEQGVHFQIRLPLTLDETPPASATQ
ncbi:Sporulation kinase A [Marinomonas aquimarina]|uniref:histidine kinase n=1 Tax=Marinomonas aquimarina TaxID=295068 RepID=A0A1A8TGP1_9GAMM|nr:ATP-binding protein [Marinomonas aquimarina]SBS32651.1 Sporulation kinase A [Marinomonas aquimarina]